MVREVGVHDDDEVAGGVFQAVHVGGAETEFAGARFQHDVCRGIDFLELLCDVEGAVGRGVVDDYDFVVEVAGRVSGFGAK